MKYDEKKYLLGKFPQIELSYEKNLHNKIRNIDYYITIPYGKKYFAWFKNHNNKNNLFILEIDKNKNKITSIIQTFGCFKNNLCIGNGTILYGTIFKYKNHSFFNIEDCFYYKNKNLSTSNNFEKLLETRDLFKNFKQTIYNNTQLIFGLPNMSNKLSEMKKIISDTPYKLYAIQHRFLKKNINIFYNEPITNYNIFANFLVRTVIEPDTYKIFALKNHKIKEHSHLSIPSYKKSIFMNKLFRNIKENVNLDYLEESDSEEEFENISENKFIYLEKEYIFKCVFNRKLKLWEPVEIMNDKISDINDILEIEKNK